MFDFPEGVLIATAAGPLGRTPRPSCPKENSTPNGPLRPDDGCRPTPGARRRADHFRLRLNPIGAR